MEKVGKTVFGIEHYTVKYEFAPGRGQIHGHLIGIMKDRSFRKQVYNLRNDRSAQANFLHKWSEDKVSYTAEVDIDIFNTQTPSQTDNPCMFTFTTAANKEKDKVNLLKFCQVHNCSEYCMRFEKSSSKSKHTKKKDDKTKKKTSRERKCRSGAGKEATPGKADTPGFDLCCSASIVDDSRGFKKLLIPRNHPRIIQTSMDQLQSWRGNCDAALLLYDTDPDNPDPMEISKVTDYVVSYQCKANESLKQERKQMQSLIMRYVA